MQRIISASAGGRSAHRATAIFITGVRPSERSHHVPIDQARGFESGPFHVQFVAGRHANTPADAAKGSFVAHTVIGNSTLLTLAGPVTCLDIRGNDLGLFYPVASSDPAFVSSTIHGVYIYVTVTNKSGTAGSVNFLPTTAGSATSCAPLPGIAPITSGGVKLSP